MHTHIQAALDLDFPVSVAPLCEHVNTKAVAYVQKRWMGRGEGKMVFPSPMCTNLTSGTLHF